MTCLCARQSRDVLLDVSCDNCNNVNAGPILPIMAVDSVGDAIEYINSHDKPLAL